MLLTWVTQAFPQRHTQHPIETPTHPLGEGGAAGGEGSLKGLADSAGRAQSAGWRQAQARTCLLSVLFHLSPAWCPRREGTKGAGGEERPPSGLRPRLCPRPSHRPLATSTRPSGLGKCFPSGVTVVPELLCSTRPPPPGPTPARSWVRAWGTHVDRVKGSREGLQARGQGWQQGQPWAGGLRGSGCSSYLQGRKLGCELAGGCLRQEGPIGQSRVEGKDPSWEIPRAGW